jgi:hypothetical protein
MQPAKQLKQLKDVRRRLQEMLDSGVKYVRGSGENIFGNLKTVLRTDEEKAELRTRIEWLDSEIAEIEHQLGLA